MAQPVEEQIKIIQAYANGQPVYKRSEDSAVGEKVEEKDHQFDFQHTFYSLTPLDWCTGKEAIDAYEIFLRYGSGNDSAPDQEQVTDSATNMYTGRQSTYERDVIDVLGTFSIFIAGAEWVMHNKDTGIDFQESLKSLRVKYSSHLREQLKERDAALSQP